MHKEHVFAFARTFEGRSCIVIVPRWTAKLMDAVNELPLRERVWARYQSSAWQFNARDAHAGRVHRVAKFATEEGQGERSLRVATAFAEFPVAVSDATLT